MTEQSKPAAPSRQLPAIGWEHYQLYKAVREAISSLPIYFRTETHISGIMATDLHTLNTVLGATIEEQVVRTLNLIRNTWDPDEKYALYSLVRQAQTFPDVLLRKTSSDEILLGIELKGWYLLAKEAEPSLRFQTTGAACAKQDLIVVVPWVLGNVISGSPILFEPFIERSTQPTIATTTGNTFAKASRILASRFKKESGPTRRNLTRFWIDRIPMAAAILAGWRARE